MRIRPGVGDWARADFLGKNGTRNGEGPGRTLRVVDRSRKSRLPLANKCRRGKCTVAASEGSTIIAWAVVGNSP